MQLDFESCTRALSAPDILAGGRVTRVSGDTIEAILPRAQTGAIYRIAGHGRRADLLAEVIGFRERETILAPFGEARGISPEDPVLPEGGTDEQSISDACLGRIVDALAEPLDDGPPIPGRHVVPLYRSPPNPLRRRPIDHRLATGTAVIDAMTACGQGQRLGIFAGPGIGKSTLLGMLARFSQADVNVVALIGERGREVRSFIEQELGPDGLARSVVIVTTGDKASILRVRAAFLAMAIAEYFRDQGKKVLLLLDSLTRLAHAAREIGLAAGEPPTTRGYPPSVFSMLPKLLERAGNAEGAGTITSFFTVLVEGDDMTEPVADAVRGILDGHLVLSRRLAEGGQYPAIDVGASLSRVAEEIVDPEHARAARAVREIFARKEEVKDLVQIGAYRKGVDTATDRALLLAPKVLEFFRQERSSMRPPAETIEGLRRILEGAA